MLCALQVIPALGTQRLVLNASYLVDGIAQIPGDMKLVKSNLLLSTRQALQRRADLGGPHIHGNAFYRCLLRL